MPNYDRQGCQNLFVVRVGSYGNLQDKKRQLILVVSYGNLQVKRQLVLVASYGNLQRKKDNW